MGPLRDGSVGHVRLLARVGGGLVLAAMGLVPLAGCGSVGDVGTGASRSGVQPVRGVYGYSSQRATSPQETQKRVEALARANRKASKTDGAESKAIKALADAASEATPDAVAAVRAPLEAEVKMAVVRLERGVVQPAGTGYVGEPPRTEYYADEYE